MRLPFCSWRGAYWGLSVLGFYEAQAAPSMAGRAAVVGRQFVRRHPALVPRFRLSAFCAGLNQIVHC